MSSINITSIHLRHQTTIKNMNQKFVVIAIFEGVPECYGSFKKFCLAKGLTYQTLLNKRQIPKVGEPVNIGNYKVFKVEAI